MKFKILNPCEYKNWDELLLNSTVSSIFHSSFWAKVLVDSYHFTPVYLASIQNNSFSFLLPLMSIDHFFSGKHGVSLPFTDYCEPIVTNGFTKSEIFNEIYEYSHSCNWNSVELRGSNKYFADQTFFVRYYIHKINLTDNPDKIFIHFKSNVRRNIRKAERSELSIKIDNSYEGIKNYYKLHCLTRKRHGIPPQPFHFFRNIYEHIITKGHGTIINAIYKNEVIATAVYLHFGHEVVYKFGASNKLYQHLRANNLIMWHAIQLFSNQGYNILNLGKTDLENEGLRRFKLSWGAQESELKYFKYDFKKSHFIKGKVRENSWFTKILNKMPVKFLELSGSLFYKYTV